MNVSVMFDVYGAGYDDLVDEARAVLEAFGGDGWRVRVKAEPHAEIAGPQAWHGTVTAWRGTP